MPNQAIKKLPDGWVEIPLKEIAEWGSGGTPKRSESSYYGGDIPWVKTGDLGPKKLKKSSEFITELGVKKSSAQLTKLYSSDEVVGKQVVAVVNFRPKQIATIMSECLVLGAVGDDGKVTLLQTERLAKNGLRIG